MIGRMRSHHRHRAFTLLELLVAVTIIAILASLVLVLVAQVRERGRRLHCAGNLRNWATGIMAFAQERRGLVPSTCRLSDLDPCPDTIFPTKQPSTPTACWCGTCAAPWDRANNLNAEEMLPYLDGGEGFAGVAKWDTTRLAGIWNCPSAKWTRTGGWGDGGGTPALHWGYSYFGRVSEWKDHRGVGFAASHPNDLGDRRLAAERLVMSDALFIWEGNYVETGWLYNHSRSTTRDWDGRLLQMAGMNQAFGDGSVRWKDAPAFDYARMQARDPAVPRVKSDDLLTYY